MEENQQDFAKKAVEQIDSFTKYITGLATYPIKKSLKLVSLILCLIILLPFITILIIDLVVRVLDNYVFSNKIWITEGILGIFFLLLGVVLLSRKNK